MTWPITRGRLHVRPAGARADLVHRVEDPALHGLQAVAHVGQRAALVDVHAVRQGALEHGVGGVDALAVPGEALTATSRRRRGCRRRAAQRELVVAQTSTSASGAASSSHARARPARRCPSAA